MSLFYINGRKMHKVGDIGPPPDLHWINIYGLDKVNLLEMMWSSAPLYHGCNEHEPFDFELARRAVRGEYPIEPHFLGRRIGTDISGPYADPTAYDGYTHTPYLFSEIVERLRARGQPDWVDIHDVSKAALLEALWDCAPMALGWSELPAFDYELARRAVHEYYPWKPVFCGRYIGAPLFYARADARPYDNATRPGTFARIVQLLRSRGGGYDSSDSDE